MAIMTTRPIVVRSHNDIESLQRLIRFAAWNAREKIFKLDRKNPMEVLHALKFEMVGHTPLKSGRPQRLTEQLYRTFKAMATLAAARHVGPELFRHGEGLCLRLGYFSPKEFPELDWHRRVFPGPEIESVHEGIVDAEVFSAVSTVSNAALKNAFKRLLSSRAGLRFVFFYAPGEEIGRRKDLEHKLLQQVQLPDSSIPNDIEIWALEKREIM